MAYIGNKPANKAIVASDLDPAVITGQTALAVAPADTDEFLISDAGTLKRLDASLIGGGKVLQVVTATDSTERSTTSTTFVTASNTLSVNITPSSSSSKILVTVSTSTYANNGVDGLLTVYRDSTDLGNSNRGFQANGGDDAHVVGSTFSVLDSPNTTSQITYQAYIHGSSSYAMKMNYGGSKGTIIAMEIGA